MKRKMWVGRKNVVKTITLVSIIMLLLSSFIPQIFAPYIPPNGTPKNKVFNVTSGETFILSYNITFNQPDDGFFALVFYWAVNETDPNGKYWNFTYESFVAKFADGTGFTVPVTATLAKGPDPTLPGVYRHIVSIGTGEKGESKNGAFWVNITVRAAGQSGGIYINHTAPSDHNMTISMTIVAEATMIIEPEGQCKIHISPIPVPVIPTVYLRPATITATAVGQTFTVNIRIDNVTDLYSWSIGLTWNSSVLECTGFSEGPFLKSGGPTISIPGTINNTAGEIYPAYTYTLTTDTGVSGSGTLANATFGSKAPGTFNVHLAEVSLLNSKLEMVPANIVGVFTVVWDSVAYHVITLNNLTIEASGRCRIYNYAFIQPKKMISFNVTGPDGMAGFCNVTIPKALLSANETHPWVILMDGNPIGYIKTENATHTFIRFVYTLSTHEVQIIGSWVIPLRPLNYTLTISVTAGGTTNPSPGTYTYTAGTVVQVLAIPDTYYVFDNWTLDGISNMSNPINVTMNTNHTLRAFFRYSPPPGPSIDITPIGKTISVTSGETFTLVYKFRFNEPEKGVFATTFYWDTNESLPDKEKWNFTYIGFVAKFADGSSFWGPVTATIWKSAPSPGYYRYSVTISESYGETKNGDFWVNVTMRAAGQSGGAYINHTAPSYQNITIRSTFIAEKSFVTVPDGVCTIHVTPAPIRDVAIIGVSLFRTIVGEGVPTAFTEIYVTAENQGNLTEIFDVIVYYDSKVIVTQTGVTLDAGCNVTLTFIWYTAYVKKGHYTIKAVATVVSGELDTADNTFVNGPFIVTIPGDIDGDGYVYTKDLGLLGKAWRARRGDPRYNPNADIDCDGNIYVKDLAWLGRNWRKRV